MLPGHILHTNQLNFLHRNVPELDQRLVIDVLPKEPTILIANTPVSFQVNMLTKTLFIFQNFQSEFTKFMHQNDNIDGFLVRLCDYITSIICHDDYYHLFDSYARDANGFPDQAGKAVAIYFPNSVSLCRHFQQFGDCRNIMAEQQIDVFPVQVNRPVSSDESNLNLLADIIVGDDSCPPSTSARDASTKGKRGSETKKPGQNSGSSLTSKRHASTKGKGKKSSETKKLCKNSSTSRVYSLRKEPPAKRVSNSL